MKQGVHALQATSEYSIQGFHQLGKSVLKLFYSFLRCSAICRLESMMKAGFGVSMEVRLSVVTHQVYHFLQRFNSMEVRLSVVKHHVYHFLQWFNSMEVRLSVAKHPFPLTKISFIGPKAKIIFFKKTISPSPCLFKMNRIPNIHNSIIHPVLQVIPIQHMENRQYQPVDVKDPNTGFVVGKCCLLGTSIREEVQGLVALQTMNLTTEINNLKTEIHELKSTSFCNICLDKEKDCRIDFGHKFCCSCVDKLKATAAAENEQPQCPICKKVLVNNAQQVFL